jgi:hypothetical protein
VPPHLLFKLEVPACELLLQALIGVVDAQLLKAVGVKRLKSIDVKDGDGQVGLDIGCP